MQSKKISKVFLLFSVVFFLLLAVNFVDAVTQQNLTGKVFFNDILSTAGGDGGDRVLALDNNDYPHICSFYRPAGATSGLRHSYWNGTSWQIEDLGTVDDSANYGQYCSIAIDQGNNDIYISYYNAGDLYYTKRINGTWSGGQVIDTTGDTGRNTSIVLSNGTPHIFYQYYVDASNANLKHAYWTGAGWNVSTLVSGNVGQDISSTVDQDNNIHITYIDMSDNGVKYRLLNSNGSWNPTTITVANSFVPPLHSISVGSDDLVRIGYLYSDGVTISLRVATGTIAGFSSSIFVASSGNYYPGLNPSIALDDLNNKYLSYRYFGYDYLGYAYSDNSGIYSGIVTDSVTAVKDTTSSIRRGDDNSFVSYYYAADDTINLMLVDTKVPEGTARLSGKANNLFGWELLSSDYAKMGGAKYYCIDETNTCDPVTSLTSATDFGNYSASSSNVDAIYLRLKDWAKNTTSITLSSSSIVPERESLDSDDLNRKIVQEDLVYQWKAMPKHPSRYWIKTIRYKSYAPKYKLGSHYLLKRYWKIQTNLYKYKKNTRKKLIVAENNYQRCLVKTDCSKKALKIYKKELKKYQNAMFKVRVTFYYNRKIVKMLKSKNSDLKKLSIKKVKKKLWLKYYNKSTKKWENVTKVKAINNPASNKVKNSLLINISYFKQKNTLFTIGVK